jgi:steroid 5-alpha reductase family enzyme
VRYAAGFAVVFILAVFAGGLVAWGTSKLVEAVGLRPVDRVLGAAFGLVRGVVLLLAAGRGGEHPRCERQRGGPNRWGRRLDGGAQGD